MTEQEIMENVAKSIRIVDALKGALQIASKEMDDCDALLRSEVTSEPTRRQAARESINNAMVIDLIGSILDYSPSDNSRAIYNRMYRCVK